MWWTIYVIDPVAVPLVARLARMTWISPDRLTLFSILVALAASGSFLTQHFVIGALTYQVSFLVDCLDGKLSAMRTPRHRWGGWVDAAGDGVRFATCSIGLVGGLATSGYDASGQVCALVAYPLLRWTAIALSTARPVAPPPARAILLPPHPVSVLRAARARRAHPGSTVDTEALAFTLGPLASVPFWGLVGAAVVDALHVGFLVLQGIRALRSEAARS
jgi:hypothetical protein